MAFGVSPGVYTRIIDQSFVVSGAGVLSGGVVISSNRGPVSVNVVTNSRQFVEQYGYPDRNNPSMWAAYRFLQRAGFLSVRRVINDAVASTGTLFASDGTTPQLDITAANPGAWGNDITVDVVTDADAPAGVFRIEVSENDAVVESFIVSRDQNAVNGFGNSIFVEDVINGNSRYITVVDSPDADVIYNDTTVDLTGGANDTTAPTEAMIISAWDDFVNIEDVSARLLINAGWATAGVGNKMLAVAESRRDAYAILDVPQADNDDPTAMVTYRKDTLGADSYHGGLYGGWVKIIDERAGYQIEIPVSGDVAANFVQSNEAGYIWDAVMGLERGSIPNNVGMTKNFTEGERDQLYAAGVNPVTKIGVNNAVIWGQKSLQSFASGLDRANVVMNVKDIDVSIKNALLPYVGKSNTESTRNSANYIVSTFLENRQRLGGLYAYAVDTSTEINTPQVIDNNEFLMDSYIQPNRTMEFIRSSIVVTSTGVSLA